jgi:hypothetical protein
MIEHIVQFGIFSLMYWVGYYFGRRSKTPKYKWTCPKEGCSFESRASDQVFLTKLGADHIKGHLERNEMTLPLKF